MPVNDESQGSIESVRHVTCCDSRNTHRTHISCALAITLTSHSLPLSQKDHYFLPTGVFTCSRPQIPVLSSHICPQRLPVDCQVFKAEKRVVRRRKMSKSTLLVEGTRGEWWICRYLLINFRTVEVHYRPATMPTARGNYRRTPRRCPS
jgi:hypothetical protein